MSGIEVLQNLVTQLRHVINISIENYGDTKESLFEDYDKDGNGVISLQEFGTALEQLGFVYLEEHEVKSLSKFADENGDGLINYTEFCDFVDEKREIGDMQDTEIIELAGVLKNCLENMVGIESLNGLWDTLDKNKDDKISTMEFRDCIKTLGFQLDVDEAGDLMSVIDISNDNFIDREEFALFFQKGRLSVVESFGGEEN